MNLGKSYQQNTLITLMGKSAVSAINHRLLPAAIRVLINTAFAKLTLGRKETKIQYRKYF